jgi:hypothetical protein
MQSKLLVSSVARSSVVQDLIESNRERIISSFADVIKWSGINHTFYFDDTDIEHEISSIK